MIDCKCSCGWPVHTPIKITVTCPKCKNKVYCNGTDFKSSISKGNKPVKPNRLWVRYIKLLRIPEDRGVGDTLQRIFAKIGGERFKLLAKRIGIPCGCTERQDYYNREHPY